MPPEMRTSTSILRATALSASVSPSGTTWCPCRSPIRSGPCVSTSDGGSAGFCQRAAERQRASVCALELTGAHLVVLATDTTHVGSDAPEVLPRLAVTHVARAHDLLDLARNLREPDVSILLYLSVTENAPAAS